jgi:NAD-dependent DNA ligase
VVTTDTGPAVTPTRLAFTTPCPTVSIDGRSFVLTGKFVTGTRAYCESLVTARGGLCLPSVSRRAHYLVVGGLGSDQWIASAFGTEIEKAVQLRAAGHDVSVVPEDAWAGALRL